MKMVDGRAERQFECGREEVNERRIPMIRPLEPDQPECPGVGLVRSDGEVIGCIWPELSTGAWSTMEPAKCLTGFPDEEAAASWLYELHDDGHGTVQALDARAVVSSYQDAKDLHTALYDYMAGHPLPVDRWNRYAVLSGRLENVMATLKADTEATETFKEQASDK